MRKSEYIRLTGEDRLTASLGVEASEKTDRMSKESSRTGATESDHEYSTKAQTG